LHRHFADSSAFLAEFVLDRISWISDQAAALLATAGTGTVAGNLTEALLSLFRLQRHSDLPPHHLQGRPAHPAPASPLSRPASTQRSTASDRLLPGR
jgi:hypothetical protein